MNADAPTAQAPSSRLRLIALLLCAAGIAVRVYTDAVVSHFSNIKWEYMLWLWHFMPFLVIAYVALLPLRQGPVAAAALAVFVADAAVAITSHVRFGQETSVHFLAVASMPLFNLFLIAPATAAIVAAVSWWPRRRAAKHRSADLP